MDTCQGNWPRVADAPPTICFPIVEVVTTPLFLSSYKNNEYGSTISVSSLATLFDGLVFRRFQLQGFDNIFPVFFANGLL
jgi:hypothetical protein